MKPEDLIGKDVRGLNSLQVSGFSRFDSGFSADSPATVDGTPINGVWLPAAEGYGLAVASLLLALPRIGRSLQLEIEARSDNASGQAILARFNGDAGALYDYSFFNDQNATLTAAAPTIAGTSGQVGRVIPSGAAAGAVGAGSVTINNADSTTQRKNWRFTTGGFDTDAAGSSLWEAGHGQWRNATDPIQNILLFPNAGAFAYIRARLYILA